MPSPTMSLGRSMRGIPLGKWMLSMISTDKKCQEIKSLSPQICLIHLNQWPINPTLHPCTETLILPILLNPCNSHQTICKCQCKLPKKLLALSLAEFWYESCGLVAFLKILNGSRWSKSCHIMALFKKWKSFPNLPSLNLSKLVKPPPPLKRQKK